MSIDELTTLSRYYGADPEYVIAGGGNTSFKDASTLYIKGSGTALADIQPQGFVRMDRQALGRIWEKTYPVDADEREQAVLADMMGARKPGEEQKRPSVETLLHDLLPFAYVVHTHPALVNGLTCSRQGEGAAKALFGDEAIWIESTNPGYILSGTVKAAMEAHSMRTGKNAPIILLQNHGVFVSADDVESIKAIYRRIMDALRQKIKRQADFSDTVTSKGRSQEIALALAQQGQATTVLFRWNREIAALVKDQAAFYPVSSAFTPDHIVYAGSDPLFIKTLPDDPERIPTLIQEAVQAHTRMPKIVAVQELGVFGIGTGEQAAARALELFQDAIKVAVYTESFGGPEFMTQDKIDFINNWEVERYRTRVSTEADQGSK
ncbi:MAG: class II aldolase/adducin family protein [Treponema sp.]|jgi:rhamnose utilization protein RhaD (predicted bifunctional aldolase and dehydrogenase)|nr:class II aldolase/adducin family protein [Treponema sp.]